MADEEAQTVTDDVTLSADDTQNTDVSTDETTDQGAEQPAKVEFDEAQQKVFDTAIAKKGFQNKKQELESQATIGGLQQQITDMQAHLPQSVRPTIPELPDQYDDDFAAQMATRDQAIQEVAAFDAKQQAVQQLQNAQALATQQTQQKAAQDLAITFVEKAGKLGVNEEQLTKGLQTVGSYGGIGNDLSDFVMGHDQGGLIVAYLAENPAEVLTIQSMSPMQGAAHLVSNVTPKAIANKQTTGAPAPVDDLGGNGTNPSDEGPAGARYE